MMACKQFVLSLCFLGALTLSIAQADALPSATSEQVTITDVKVRMSDHGPVVLLQAEGKAIPIFVDVTVAVSIQGALNGERLPRPMSHDLMHTILEVVWRESHADRHHAEKQNLLWGVDRGVPG